MNPRVVKVIPQDDYLLLLTFDNEEKKIFDVKPYLDKGIFRFLRDKHIFNSVKVSFGTVEWSKGQDFCPDTLYLESYPYSL